uniref:Uncharacterized protein n=1 Tax=Panagrolaimus sp. ES5 TaxID=591445 RepID=A0AC34F2P8_9BILA
MHKNVFKNQFQLAWTRGVAIAGLLLSSAYYAYIKKSNIVIYPDGSLPFHGKAETELNLLEQNLRHGVVTQIADLKMDQIQYAMARAVVALSDCIPGMSDDAKEILAEERSKYATGLLRYLQNKRGEDIGTKIFAETIAFINGLYRRVEYNQAYFTYRRFVTRDNTKAKLLSQLLLSND